MTKRKLLIWIPVAAILLNGLGYLIVTQTRTPRAPSPPVAERDRGPSTGGAATTGDSPAAEEIPEQDPAQKEQIAQARRAAGLVALEAGQYEKALINFTEARALIGDKANVADLLRVTEELRRRPSLPPTAPRVSAAPAPAPPPPRAPPRAVITRRTAMRDDAPAEAPQAPAPAPAGGLLIVSTTPRSLLVQVDETPIDLTPMRTKVKAGTHRIALLDGDRRVYETTVDVKEGGTATLLKDLSRELQAEAPAESPRTTPPSSPTPSVAAREESPRQVVAAPRPSDAAPNAIVAAPAERKASAPAAASSGALQITSPGLYGVVWINGRPRGYPPLEVRDLPIGPAKIEVRVNGVEKRSSTVVVAPGLTTAVKLR